MCNEQAPERRALEDKSEAAQTLRFVPGVGSALRRTSALLQTTPVTIKTPQLFKIVHPGLM